MERFKLTDKSTSVVLPYSIDYFKIGNYYVVVDGSGTSNRDYLYARDRHTLEELIDTVWSDYNYEFWIAYLVKNSEPMKNASIKYYTQSEQFINAIEDTELLSTVYLSSSSLDLFAVRGFVNNIHTSSNVINAIAEEVLSMEHTKLMNLTDVFESPLCRQSYVSQYIGKHIITLHISYAESLKKNGKLSPENKLLLARTVEQK